MHPREVLLWNLSAIDSNFGQSRISSCWSALGSWPFDNKHMRDGQLYTYKDWRRDVLVLLFTPCIIKEDGIEVSSNKNCNFLQFRIWRIFRDEGRWPLMMDVREWQPPTHRLLRHALSCFISTGQDVKAVQFRILSSLRMEGKHDWGNKIRLGQSSIHTFRRDVRLCRLSGGFSRQISFCQKDMSSSQPIIFKHSTFWNPWINQFPNSEIFERVRDFINIKSAGLLHVTPLHLSISNLQSNGRLENDTTNWTHS